MMITNMPEEEKISMDARFRSFMVKMLTVARYAPKEQYLYPIMSGVPFRDLEVALDLALLERSKANDNQD